MKKYILFLIMLKPFIGLSQNYDDLEQSAFSKLVYYKDYKGAISIYDELIKLKPNDAPNFDFRAEAKQNLKDYFGALKDYNKAIFLSPRYIVAYFDRGKLKVILKDYQGAMVDYNKEIELSVKDAACYLVRGDLKVTIKDFTGAMKDYNKVIEFDQIDLQDLSTEKKSYNDKIVEPQLESAYLKRGTLKSRLKDYRGAIEDYNILVNLNQGYKDCYYLRGFAKSQIKDIQGAIQDYGASIALDPNSTESADAYYRRGLLKMSINDKNGGCLDLSKAGELGETQAYDLIKKYCN